MPEAKAHDLRGDLVARFYAAFPDPGWPVKRPLTDFPSDVSNTWIDGGIIAHFRADFAGRKWREVSDEALVYMASDFAILNREALAYFLPAFLVCYVRNEKGVASDLSVYFTMMLERVAPLCDVGFTRKQMNAIYDFLVWWENDGTEDDHEPMQRWQSRVQAAIDGL
jgi:hypothetical protein